MRKILETNRLILRGWQDSDADSLFKYASDKRVGPPAGWIPHESIGYSKAVIRTVFAKDEVYAICLKGGDDKPIGSIGLNFQGSDARPLGDDEAELGYWIGVPFWGKEIAPEAAKEVIRHGFEDLGLSRIYCGYFEGNNKSKRVQEKCGFTFDRIEKTYVIMFEETRKEYINVLCASDWEKHGY